MTALRVAARFMQKLGAEDPLQGALDVHVAMRQWVGQFPHILRAALQEATGLPRGWVWQDRFVPFFEEYDEFEGRLEVLDAKLRGMGKPVRMTTGEPPARARVSGAISDFQFFDGPEGRDAIAYPIKSLKVWEQAFSRWVQDSIRILQAEI